MQTVRLAGHPASPCSPKVVSPVIVLLGNDSVGSSADILSNACGSAGCKRLKKKHTGHTQARSRHGIILSDSDSDAHMDIDTEGCDSPSIPDPHTVPSLRASTGRRRRGRADDMQGRADDMDWAAELAEEEASLDVSFPPHTLVLHAASSATSCVTYSLHPC